MKKHNDHMFFLYLPFIVSFAACLYYYIRAVLHLGIKEVDKGMSTGELIALIAPVSAALLTGALALWAQVVQFKKDRQHIDSVNETVKDVRSDTAEIKPRVQYSERHIEEVHRDISRTIVPAMEKLDMIGNYVKNTEEMVKSASSNIPDMRRLLADVSAIYEQNAALEREVRECRQTIAGLERTHNQVLLLEKELADSREINKSLENKVKDYEKRLVRKHWEAKI